MEEEVGEEDRRQQGNKSGTTGIRGLRFGKIS